MGGYTSHPAIPQVRSRLINLIYTKLMRYNNSMPKNPHYNRLWNYMQILNHKNVLSN